MKMIRIQKSMLVLAALMSTIAIEATPRTPVKGAVSGDLVFSKVFYNNMMNDAGKAYIHANYIELYNNSGDVLDITGIFLGVADNTSSTAAAYADAWTAVNMAEAHKDSIALKQIFRIPTDKTCLLAPGQSIVICNAAENHTLVASAAPDLSAADFEVKSEHSVYKDHHNVDVPALDLVYTNTPNNTFLQFMSPGPYGVVLLAADTRIDDCPEVHYRNYTDGTMFKLVPASQTLDVADLVEHSAKTEPDVSQKRMPESYDAGWAATTSPGGNHGEALKRKTASTTSDGRIILSDTNNSSHDFEVTTDLGIRDNDCELTGMTETSLDTRESCRPVIHNTMGMKIGQAQRGVNIINGKKVVF